jgi:RimJ/RimL family protein N-acetyltransferase
MSKTISRLTAEIDVRNKSSIELSKKLGYRREALAKKLIYEAGRWNDCYIFAVTAEDLGIKTMKPVYRTTSSES